MNNEKKTKALERIGELLSQLPEEDVEPTIIHLLGVVNGAKIVSVARRQDADASPYATPKESA